jgi:hypothetical protein
MPIEVFAALSMIVMVISVMINIILLLRIDVLHKMLRFLKISAAMLYAELQATKQQNTHEDDRDISTHKNAREADGEDGQDHRAE